MNYLNILTRFQKVANPTQEEAIVFLLLTILEELKITPKFLVASEGISAKYKLDAWIILIELPE